MGIWSKLHKTAKHWLLILHWLKMSIEFSECVITFQIHFEMFLLNTGHRPQARVDVHNTTFGQQKAFRIQYLNIATDSLGENPVLMLSLWLCLQCFLQSVRQEATRSSRTPTVAPPSAPAGCSSHPCRTSSVTTPSHRAGTSFRFLTSQRVCPPSVWR